MSAVGTRGTGVLPRAFLVAAAASILAAAFLLPASPASAALSYPKLGQISGPAPGELFGKLQSESVAVNDHNGHIYVADTEGADLDSQIARVYDFSSSSDTSPSVWDGSATPAGSFGSGPSANVAVAVDNSSGDVYVADSAHAVIDKFDQDGNLIESFGDTEPAGQLAGTQTPAGSFSPPGSSSFGIAVNQASGDLYAIDAGHQVIDVFDSSGTYLEQLTETPGGLYGCSGSYTDGIAVNGKSGQLLVSDSCDLKVYRFDLATGSFVAPAIDGSDTPAEGFGTAYTSVAANDSSGDLYATDFNHQVVDRLDSAGAYAGDQITGLGANPRSGPRAVAVGQASGQVYVSEYTCELEGTFGCERNAYSVPVFGPKAVLLPTITTEGPTEVGPHAATLNGAVNPEGIQLSTCGFEWGTTTSYGHTATCEPAAASIPSDEENHAVEARIEGLEAGTIYHYRLLATNANGTEFGGDKTLGTPPPPSIDAAAAINLTETSVDLTAQINPRGAATSCSFEYGTTISYGISVPCEPANLGSGNAGVEVARHVEGLSPETTYHWRVLATNPSGTTTSFDHTFIFFLPPPHETCPGNEVLRTGPSAALPDCRAFEMVTPPAKNAALIGDVIFGLAPHISQDGSRLILSSVQCFGGSVACPVNRLKVGTPFAFTRGGAGWHTTPLAPPASQFDVNTTWDVNADAGTTLFSAPTPPYGEDDFYAQRPDGSITHIGPVTPPQLGERGPAGSQGSPLATTADLSHVVFAENPPNLWPFDQTTGSAIYEYAGTGGVEPFLVGVSGPQANTDLISLCGTELPGGGGALSADGRTVYFVAKACSSGSGENAGTPVPAAALYARVDGESAAARTVAISERSPTECSGECLSSPPADASFEGASADGSVAVFSSTQQLTDEASEDSREGDSAELGCAATTGPNGCNLYLYQDPQEQLLSGQNLIDVSAGDTSGLGPQVQGVMAISADGSHVYFVARGVLAANEGAATDPATGLPQHAQAGAENLYLYQLGATHLAGQTTFIATLPASDNSEADAGGIDAWRQGPGLANVTPDGRFLIFPSHAALTADTGDSGVEQIFRYDASSGDLLRVSIGERGFNDNGNNPSSTLCKSALCPSAATIVPLEFGATRRDPTMSDDGSYVFFTSPVALTPGALSEVQIGVSPSNGIAPEYAQNAYEWEAPGSGGCVRPEGCVRLISDGRDVASAGHQTCRSSAVCLIGTNASGSDVFFTTTDQLVPSDTDTQLDFYDARVGGGFANPPAPTSCQGDACKTTGTEQGSLPSPSTPNFSGPEEGPSHPRCSKGFVKKHGSCVRRRRNRKHHKRRSHKRVGASRGDQR